MENEVKVSETEEVVETPAVEAEPVAEEVSTEVVAEDAVVAEPVAGVESDFAASKTEEENAEEPTVAKVEGQEEASIVTEEVDFSKKEEEKEEEKSKESSDAPETEDKSKEDEEDKKKYELLETEFTNLQQKYSELEEKYNELVAFKAQVEDAKKDEMISKFCFLSDEDKKEVVENKSKYSVDEIEAKLSVICVRNKVNFDLDDSSKNDINIDETPDVTTYNVSNEGESIPAWIMAVKNNQKK